MSQSRWQTAQKSDKQNLSVARNLNSYEANAAAYVMAPVSLTDMPTLRRPEARPVHTTFGLRSIDKRGEGKLIIEYRSQVPVRHRGRGRG